MVLPFSIYDKHKNGSYASLILSQQSQDYLADYVENVLKISNYVDPTTFHCTLMYSRVPCPKVEAIQFDFPISCHISGWEVFPSKDGASCLVARIECKEAVNLYTQMRSLGASYDYDEYKPHITICTDYVYGHIHQLDIPLEKLYFDNFEITGLDLEMVTTNKE